MAFLVSTLKSCIILVAATALIASPKAQATEVCSRAFETTALADSDLEFRLASAFQTARKFSIEIDPSFRRLSAQLQMKSLEDANRAITLLPIEVYKLIRDAHFRVLLVGESLRNVPGLTERYENAGDPTLADRAGMTISDLRTVYVVAGKQTRHGEFYDVQRITLHELGHAFDHSFGIEQARKASVPGADSIRLTKSSVEFQAAHKAAEKDIRGTSIESISEYFADMFYFYFAGEEMRMAMKDRMPRTHRFFQNLFAQN